MSEIYNFIGSDNKGFTWFNNFLLESAENTVHTLAKSDGFDSKNLEVNLTINGIEIRVEDFNHLLDKWSDMVQDHVKEELNYLSSKEAVVELAEKLIREKLDNIHEILNNVENSLWKLQD